MLRIFLLVFNIVSHKWAQWISEISSWTLEDKFYLFIYVMGKFKSKVMLVSGCRSDSNPGFSREFSHFDCVSAFVGGCSQGCHGYHLPPQWSLRVTPTLRTSSQAYITLNVHSLINVTNPRNTTCNWHFSFSHYNSLKLLWNIPGKIH